MASSWVVPCWSYPYQELNPSNTEQAAAVNSTEQPIQFMANDSAAHGCQYEAVNPITSPKLKGRWSLHGKRTTHPRSSSAPPCTGQLRLWRDHSHRLRRRW